MALDAFLKVIERLPEPWLLVAGDGVILGANRRLARLGLEPDELRGKRLADVTAQSSEAVADYLRRCSKTSSPLPGTLTLRGIDGRELACRANGCVLHPSTDAPRAVIMLRLESKGTSIGQFLALNQKIDELGRQIRRRQRVEDELREQKEWLGVTLSSIGDAVIATDTEGRIIFMNPVAQALTGWGQDEASDRPLAEVFRIINEETRHTVENPVDKCLREGTIVGLANHTLLIAKDGTEHSIDDTAAPIREPGGQVKGVVLVFHDVGDRRTMERELYSRAEKLAENDRRKDEFLAMLAHELRNPLSSINNAVQLLGKLKTHEEHLWAKDVVQRQVKHLARLIDDLLDVSRISRGKIRLRKETLDLSPVVGAAVEAVRPFMEERKHELGVSLVNEGLRLEADPIRLEQILVNLLTNAAKYTEAGGRITLMACRERGEVVITVRDNGMGLASELLPRVFELFAQGDRTIARSEGGLGIGLTLVRKLAEMHGGTVVAASEGPGKGSEFTVRLPALVDATSRSPSRGVRLPRVALQNSRVLVVDDNADSATALARILRLLGHDVRVANDGPAGIEEARAHRPEVVLLDIGLPGMDGYEVAERLRAEASCQSAYVIAVTGYGRGEDLRRSRAAGFDYHLVKPVDYDTLLALFAPRTD
ncbi:PAS domain-containing hybrid sensor histidine kinase/response regulator [Singulisphaera rosea]